MTAAAPKGAVLTAPMTVKQELESIANQVDALKQRIDRLRAVEATDDKHRSLISESLLWLNYLRVVLEKNARKIARTRAANVVRRLATPTDTVPARMNAEARRLWEPRNEEFYRTVEKCPPAMLKGVVHDVQLILPAIEIFSRQITAIDDEVLPTVAALKDLIESADLYARMRNVAADRSANDTAKVQEAIKGKRQIGEKSRDKVLERLNVHILNSRLTLNGLALAIGRDTGLKSRQVNRHLRALVSILPKPPK